MSEQTYHFLDLGVQVVLVLIVLFGGAKWVGETTQLVKNLTNSLTMLNHSFDEHRKEDKENFEKVGEKLEKLAIAQAAAKRG